MNPFAWITRRITGLAVAQKVRQIERESYLLEHPHYAAALQRGDRKVALAILTEDMNITKLGIMREPAFQMFFRAELERNGATEEEITTLMESLAHIRRPK